MPAALPKSIHIGCEEFAVKRTNSLSDDNDGDFRRHEGEIRVREGLRPHYERTVVVHETLHGLTERSGLKARMDREDENLEEEVVTVLAEWLTDFLRMNPVFVKYVTAKDDG